MNRIFKTTAAVLLAAAWLSLPLCAKDKPISIARQGLFSSVGSAGGRMAAYLGSYGAAAFGGADIPKPAAVIMQYTGHSEYSEDEPPTFACAGESDWIADWRTMQARLNAMSRLGIDTEFHRYPGLPHGFGLGRGTVAEGWIDDAASFWKRQIEKTDFSGGSFGCCFDGTRLCKHKKSVVARRQGFRRKNHVD